MRRGRTILDSPEAAPRTTQAGRLSNARGTPASHEPDMIRDPLSHHLGNLVTMADGLAKLCTAAGEELAEAHLDDEVHFPKRLFSIQVSGRLASWRRL